MSALALPKVVRPVLYVNIKCPKCLLLYRTGDRLHSSWYGQAPLLLSCGHAVCESCLLKFNFHKCSVCGEETLWDSRSKKQKHLYVVGLLVDSNSRSNLQSNLTHLKKSVDVIESSPAARSLARDLCQECNQVKATVQCRKCGIEVCLTCFKKIHSPQAMKKHRPEPVNLPETALSCLLPACQIHPQNTATLLCVSCSKNEDSEKFFCTSCQSFGEHRGHNVKDMSLLTEQHLPELKQTMKDLQDTVEHLQDSIKECLCMEDQADQSREYVTMQIRSYMHRIHGLLQIEEEAALSKLQTVHNSFLDTISKKLSNLEKKAQVLEGVLKHAELLVNGEVPSVHPSNFLLEMKRLAAAADTNRCLNYYTSYTNIFRIHTSKDLEDYIPGCVAVEDHVNLFVSLSDSRSHNLDDGDGSMAPQDIQKIDTSCQAVDIGCNRKDGDIQTHTDPLEAMVAKEYDTVSDCKLQAANLLVYKESFDRFMMKTDGEKDIACEVNTDHAIRSKEESTQNAQISIDKLDIIRNDIEETLIDISDVSADLTPIQNVPLPKPEQVCEKLLKGLSALPNIDEACEPNFTSDLDMHVSESVTQLEKESKLEHAPDMSKTLMDLGIEDLVVLNQANFIKPCSNVLHADQEDLFGDMLVKKQSSVRKPVSENTAMQLSQELIMDIAANERNKGLSSASSEIDIKAKNPNSNKESALEEEKASSVLTGLLSKNPLPASPVKDNSDSEVLVSKSSGSQFKSEYVERQWEDLGARPKLLTLDKTAEEEKVVEYPLHKTDSTSSLLSCESSVASSLVPAKGTALLMEEHVRVTHVDTPSLFYVQRSTDFEKIAKLNERLNKYARRPSKIKEAVPFVGKLYLGRFTYDGTWYRAQVLSVKPTAQEVEVLYIDYGNCEILKTSRLHDCPPQYQLDQLPSFYLTCGLWHILPGRGEVWDSEAITTFTELVKNSTLQLYVIAYEAEKCLVDVRRPTSTVGIVNDMPVSIREVLIFLELAVYVNDSPQDKYNKKAGLLTACRFNNPEIPFGSDGVAVLLSAVVSPKDFHLHLASSIEYFCQLMEEMQAHYNSRHVEATLDWNVYAPKIGMSCVAKYSGDGRWHRAIIEDLPGNRKVDIKFVDIGKKERVKHKRLRKIKDKFISLPAQAVPCCLTGIGESWPNNSASLIEKVFDTQDIMALFHSYEDEVCSVSLKVMINEEEIDIGEQLILINEAQDSSGRSFRKQQSPSEGNVIKVNASGSKLFHQNLSPRLGGEVQYLDITSPTCIHLRLATRIAGFKELRTKLKQEMQDCVSTEDFSPCFGDICAVRQKTGTFARVRILEIKEPHAKVHFVDCGGIQQLQLSDLLPLPEKFSRIENMCTVVCLAGILPPGGQGRWPGITVDRLKEFLTKLDKLYIKSMGDPKQHPDFEIKVIPVEMGYTYESLGGPFEVNSKVYVSINDWLVQEGLALPDHSRSSSSLFNKSGNTDEQENASFFEFQEQMFFRDLQLFCEEQEKPVLLDEKDTPCKTIEDWLPCPLPDSPKFSAIATYVDHSGIIYLQPVSNANTLDIISKGQTMQFVESLPSDNDLCWSPGDPVIAKFFLDRKWYRATVLKLLDNGDVLVQFVDYGNTDTVKIANLRRDIIFSQIPIQCCRAALHGIEPNTIDGVWPIKVLDFLHQTVVEKECLVTVMEKSHPEKPLQVQLSLVTLNIDVIPLLVDKLKLCRRIKPKGIPVPVLEEQDSRDVVIEDDEFQELLSFPTVNLPSMSLPSNSSEKILVKITAIKDPAHVYISPVFKEEPSLSKYKEVLKAETDAYKKFFTLINTNPSSFEPVKDPQIGGIYLGMFTTQEWYRVQVVNKLSRFVTALFVDTGNLEDIPIVHLKVCPASGRTIPAQAVGVELYRIEPPQGSFHWSEEAMTAMIDCLMGSEDKLFIAAILDMGNSPMVELYNTGAEDLAYTGLINKKLIKIYSK